MIELRKTEPLKLHYAHVDVCERVSGGREPTGYELFVVWDDPADAAQFDGFVTTLEPFEEGARVVVDKPGSLFPTVIEVPADVRLGTVESCDYQSRSDLDCWVVEVEWDHQSRTTHHYSETDLSEGTRVQLVGDFVVPAKEGVIAIVEDALGGVHRTSDGADFTIAKGCPSGWDEQALVDAYLEACEAQNHPIKEVPWPRTIFQALRKAHEAGTGFNMRPDEVADLMDALRDVWRGGPEDMEAMVAALGLGG